MPALPQRVPLLTAEWANLLLVSWEAPAALLRPHVHPSLALDRRGGHTHVSVVALEFHDLRLRGFRFPGVAEFPAINLRTYVREGERRGVTFLRQLVPSRLVAGVARSLYRQPFRAMRVESRPGDGHAVSYRFGSRALDFRLGAVASSPATVPAEGTPAHYFAERYWGFGTTRTGRLLRFRIQRPPWAVRTVTALDVAIDFATLYGPEWGILNGAEPASAVLAAGSAVAIEPPEIADR